LKLTRWFQEWHSLLNSFMLLALRGWEKKIQRDILEGILIN
jgi:hypothetical protein